jgi:hypothetical protein
MTGELLITTDIEAGQLILDGAKTGPAGGAVLTPVSGLDLLFDRATGHLCRVTVGLAECQQAVEGDDGELTVRKALIRLFGACAVRHLCNAMPPGPTRRSLSPDPKLAAAFSRLARFDAARATSPVSATSPLWSAESAALALRAGLRDRAHAEARAAVAGLAALLTEAPLPDQVLGPAILAAALAQADDPGAAEIVRYGSARAFSGSLSDWLDAYGSPPGVTVVSRDPGLMRNLCPSLHRSSPSSSLSGAAGPHLGQTVAVSPTVRADELRQAGLSDLTGMRWGLDLTLLPAGMVLSGLTPDTDLIVCSEQQDFLVVKVRLAPGAGDDALRRCRARLVDPAARQVVAAAPLVREDSMGAASLQIPADRDKTGAFHELWIEIVADEERPVRGKTLREVRHALRWADSALRAQRRPHGLAPQVTTESWEAMSAAGWRTCGRYWEFAGDCKRARQAARKAAAKTGALADEPGFLAETLGR